MLASDDGLERSPVESGWQSLGNGYIASQGMQWLDAQ